MRPALLTLATLLTACGPAPAGVDGSLTEICDLGFDKAVVELGAEAFTLRLVQLRGVNEDSALKVSVRLTGATLIPQVGLNLAEPMQPDGQRAKVGRNVLGDPNKDFPPIERGRIVFDTDPAKSARVSGEFSVKFQQGFAFGAGRTVHGTFEAEVRK